jgi:hypothetical protein
VDFAEPDRYAVDVVRFVAERGGVIRRG